MNGELFGCGYKMVCFEMDVIFYKIKLDKVKKINSIKRRLVTPTISNQRLNGVYSFIFIAQPVDIELKKVKKISTIVCTKSNREFSV
jgi:hypothetical protein